MCFFLLSKKSSGGKLRYFKNNCQKTVFTDTEVGSIFGPNMLCNILEPDIDPTLDQMLPQFFGQCLLIFDLLKRRMLRKIFNTTIICVSCHRVSISALMLQTVQFMEIPLRLLFRFTSSPGRLCVVIFDMVAEQVIQTIKTAIWMCDISQSKTTVTSSSARRKTKWDLHLKEGAELNMFSHDHRLNPRVPQPTSFDGVKPSFTERQKSQRSWQPLTMRKIGAEESIIAQSGFPFAIHSVSCDFRRPKRHGQKHHANVKLSLRRSHWTGDLASNDSSVCRVIENQDGLIAQADHVTCWVEVEKSKDVLQQYYHWMELISKYEALSGEKTTDAVTHTLTHQKDRSNLAQSLNISVSDTNTRSQGHSPHQLLQQFQQCSPNWDKRQLSVRECRQEGRCQFLQEGQKVENQKDLKKERVKRILRHFPASGGQVKRERKDQVKGQRSMDHLVMESKSEWESESGWRKSHKGKNGKGKVTGQVCGKNGHQAHQWRWTSSQQLQQGSQSQQQSQNSRQVCNISEFPQFSQIRHYNLINSEVFKIYHQLFNHSIKQVFKVEPAIMDQWLLFCVILAK